jgi:hypothetical protein
MDYRALFWMPMILVIVAAVAAHFVHVEEEVPQPAYAEAP